MRMRLPAAAVATTTAGTPTLSGSSNLPDGAVVTLTFDPDNNAATASNNVPTMALPPAAMKRARSSR